MRKGDAMKKLLLALAALFVIAMDITPSLAAKAIKNTTGIVCTEPKQRGKKSRSVARDLRDSTARRMHCPR